MAQQEQAAWISGRCSRYSYLFMVGLGVMVVWLHLGVLALAAFFSYLVLTKLDTRRRGSKALAVILFLIILAGIAYGLGFFINQVVRTLPEIGDKSIPAIIAWAKEYDIQLPFTDYDSLKDVAFDTLKNEVRFLGSFAKFARGASTQVLFLAAGCIVAVSLFLTPRFELKGRGEDCSENLYSGCCREITDRFKVLYGSFVTVMGAQIIISAINTLL